MSDSKARPQLDCRNHRPPMPEKDSWRRRRYAGLFRVAAAVSLLLATGQSFADTLLVSDFDGGVNRFDAATGAALGQLIPLGSGGLSYNRWGMAIGPNGNVFVASDGTNTINEYNPATGAFVTTFITLDGSTTTFGNSAFTFGPDGDLYVANKDQVLRYDQQGNFLGVAVRADGHHQEVSDLLFGPGNKLYVGSDALDQNGTGNVTVYDGATGGYLGELAPALSNGLDGVGGMAFGPDGKLYVSDLRGNGDVAGYQVLEYNVPTNSFVGVFAQNPAASSIYRLAFGPDGNLYVASDNANAIERFNRTTGQFMDYFTPAGSSTRPMGLAFEAVPEPSTAVICSLGLAMAAVPCAIRAKRARRGDSRATAEDGV